MDIFFDIDNGVSAAAQGGLCIAASGEYIAALRASEAIGSLGSAALIPLERYAELPDGALDRISLLVIEVAPDRPETLRRIKRVRSEHPDLKIIAAMARADVALVRMLVRQGISDVAELPFVPDELAAQILNVSSENPEVATSAALAPVYCVVRSVGGCGSTSVLTHLASALAASDDSRRGVCLVDFDIQGGEVANQIALKTPVSLGTLLEAGDRLDDDLVAGAVLPSRYGFSVLAAPDAIMPLEAVSLAQASAILTALRRSFSMVLVDLPADWSNWSLSIASEAQALLMVADGSIASLRQARRRIDLLESVGIEREKIQVVANRLERRLFRTIGAQEISQALRSNVVATLADEGSVLRAAQDQGVLLSETAGRSGFVKTINALAAQIRAGEI